MAIRAIPTTYRDIEFRSKLESSVAQLFDACDIPWTYEQEGYDLDGVWYLPDFWLPAAKQFVEVKGNLDDPSISKATALARAVRPTTHETVSEEAVRPAAVVVLAQPFIRLHLGVTNEVFGIGFNGVEQVDALLCRCNFCRVAFFATTEGAHDCSACGKYQNDHPYGDLHSILVRAKHRRGTTTFTLFEL